MNYVSKFHYFLVLGTLPILAVPNTSKNGLALDASWIASLALVDKWLRRLVPSSNLGSAPSLQLPLQYQLVLRRLGRAGWMASIASPAHVAALSLLLPLSIRILLVYLLLLTHICQLRAEHLVARLHVSCDDLIPHAISTTVHAALFHHIVFQPASVKPKQSKTKRDVAAPRKASNRVCPASSLESLADPGSVWPASLKLPYFSRTMPVFSLCPIRLNQQS